MEIISTQKLKDINACPSAISWLKHFAKEEDDEIKLVPLKTALDNFLKDKFNRRDTVSWFEFFIEKTLSQIKFVQFCLCMSRDVLYNIVHKDEVDDFIFYYVRCLEVGCIPQKHPLEFLPSLACTHSVVALWHILELEVIDVVMKVTRKTGESREFLQNLFWNYYKYNGHSSNEYKRMQVFVDLMLKNYYEIKR